MLLYIFVTLTHRWDVGGYINDTKNANNYLVMLELLRAFNLNFEFI